ncbi:Bug family tripartite tricarboxylate transporter substrate binding protein [Falsiroseomonas sp.]|jgi:tripartite-type tricarboxylate transporter receptor subunit TctC|uniref:Bug family tripartite tricarboxylate transporter substrate binding protein n=1 Tax=Falsiroseomonas sp. TaxID=2870721 RepID=UPI003F72AA8C
MMLRRRALLATPMALAAAPALAQGAAWPDRPTRWMVAYGAGGASDLFARMISRALAAPGVPPVVVENRPSGGGIVATEAVLSSPADGSTVLHVDNGMVVYNPALYSRLPFDPDRDLVMAGFIARFPFFVLTRRESPLTTFEELRAAGQRQALTYATPAVASPHHMAMELLRLRAGFQVEHVPYRGMPAVLQDLIAGRVDCAVADVTNALPLLSTGRARALVTFGANRARAVPDVRTATEAGIADCVADGWQGVALPHSASPDVIQRVNAAIRTAMASPEVVRQLGTTGAETEPLSVTQCAELIRRENAVWRPLIRDLGIRLES